MQYFCEMDIVKSLLGLDDKYDKVVGTLLGGANVEHELVGLMRVSDPGTRMLLLESVVSSGTSLLAQVEGGDRNAALELFAQWLSEDEVLLAKLDDWTSNEVLNKSIASFGQHNAEMVGNHYNSLDSTVTALHDSVVSSLDGTAHGFLSVQPFGSSVSHLCVAGSCDVDMVLCVSSPARVTVDADDAVELAKQESCEVLALVKAGLEQGSAFEVKELVTRARVPVLKLRHVQSNTEVRFC
jgi:hypothetical protein